MIIETQHTSQDLEMSQPSVKYTNNRSNIGFLTTSSTTFAALTPQSSNELSSDNPFSKQYLPPLSLSAGRSGTTTTTTTTALEESSSANEFSSDNPFSEEFSRATNAPSPSTTTTTTTTMQ